MARRSRAVEEALERWLEKGLLAPEQADRLRTEATAEHRARIRHWTSLALGGLGAVALLLAAVVFLGQAWDRLSGTAQTLVILAWGGLLYGGGLVLHLRPRTRELSLFVQTAGLLVVLLGMAYSHEVWEAGTLSARALGLVALALPIVLAPIHLREGAVMSGVHVALSVVYLGLFLDRTFGLDLDTIVWILDGLVLLALGVQAYLARRSPGEMDDRALMVLAVSLWAGFVLTAFTGAGPLELGEDTLLALDVWILMVTGLNLWAVATASSEVRKDQYQAHMAACVGTLGVLVMATVSEVFDQDAVVAGIAGAAVGGLGIAYALRSESVAVLRVGALLTVVGMWVFAVDVGGVLGGVGALVATGILLFWLSTRVRGDGAPG